MILRLNNFCSALTHQIKITSIIFISTFVVMVQSCSDEDIADIREAQNYISAKASLDTIEADGESKFTISGNVSNELNPPFHSITLQLESSPAPSKITQTNKSGDYFFEVNSEKVSGEYTYILKFGTGDNQIEKRVKVFHQNLAPIPIKIEYLSATIPDGQKFIDVRLISEFYKNKELSIETTDFTTTSLNRISFDQSGLATLRYKSTILKTNYYFTLIDAQLSRKYSFNVELNEIDRNSLVSLQYDQNTIPNGQNILSIAVSSTFLKDIELDLSLLESNEGVILNPQNKLVIDLHGNGTITLKPKFLKSAYQISFSNIAYKLNFQKNIQIKSVLLSNFIKVARTSNADLFANGVQRNAFEIITSNFNKPITLNLEANHVELQEIVGNQLDVLNGSYQVYLKSSRTSGVGYLQVSCMDPVFKIIEFVDLKPSFPEQLNLYQIGEVQFDANSLMINVEGCISRAEGNVSNNLSIEFVATQPSSEGSIKKVGTFSKFVFDEGKNCFTSTLRSINDHSDTTLSIRASTSSSNGFLTDSRLINLK